MGEFTVIETQEQLDAIIGERVKREREALGKKYEGYLSPEQFESKKGEFGKQIEDLNETLKGANEKITGFDKEMVDRDTKIKAYESHSVKSRIAHEAGLSYEAIDFLKGDDEEAIKKSAETLKSLMKTNQAPPLASNENILADKDAAMKKMLKQLNGKGE